MPVTQAQFAAHYENLYNSGAIYLWGANGEIITKQLCDRLYASFGSPTYNKAYYNDKLATGKGKIGADCSGSCFPLSNKDATAAGYFSTCIKTGLIGSIPRDLVCLVFNKNKTHVGAYLGNGYTIEMKDSKTNVHKEILKPSRWYYYGLPYFVEYTSPSVGAGVSLESSINTGNTIIRTFQTWLNTTYGQNLAVDGEWGPKTKKATVAAIQTIFVTKYNAKITIDGVYGAKTKAACPKWDIMTHNKEAFADLTYIIHVYLYTQGFDMDTIIRESKVSTVYGEYTKKYVMEYQRRTRGLLVDGYFGTASFYAAFS